MKKANVIRGRIENHAAGSGLAGDDEIMERARQIAITNGRRPEQCNQTDIDQARQELSATQNGPADLFEEEEGLVPRDGPFGISSGTEAPTKVATDEQTLPEELVQEGVEEAAHERMVEGNRESRRRDQAFDDQLPATGG